LDEVALTSTSGGLVLLALPLLAKG